MEGLPPRLGRLQNPLPEEESIYDAELEEMLRVLPTLPDVVEDGMLALVEVETPIIILMMEQTVQE